MLTSLLPRTTASCGAWIIVATPADLDSEEEMPPALALWR